MEDKKKVFVSHSSADKPFVRRLVDDLSKLGLDNIWYDERVIDVGDSIPQEIEKGLSGSDYVIVILSKNSAQSRWVKLELDASYMSPETLILPVLIDDCEIPALLKARKYADFRTNYEKAFYELSQTLADEQLQLPAVEMEGNDPLSQCVLNLNQMKRSDLRRWIVRELSRDELETLWRDLLDEEMENDHKHSNFSECVSALIKRMAKSERHIEFLEEVCKEVNP